MICSEELFKEIEEKYNRTIPYFGDKTGEILEKLNKCGTDQQIMMKFLYSSMPYADIADYDFNLFLSYADHALYLKKEKDWCKNIPEQLFFTDVAHYRINSEDITDCRKTFYDLLAPVIKEKNMKEAVLAVNYWCAEHVTYQASDIRTASPFTVLRSGKGRCGEESTFTVTALRSLGIPARQVYAPRWSHCDDNHAWVEVWCEGEWYFLGACEPEEELNTGWFTYAASRAMLIHSRDFTALQKHNRISENGILTFINHTNRYAKAKEISLMVIDENNKPVEHARVDFEILNYSGYFSIATLYTDENGVVRITLGLGDIHVHISKEGLSTWDMVNTCQADSFTLLLKNKDILMDNWSCYTFHAPESSILHPDKITEAQKELNKQRLETCEKLRNARIKGFYKEDMAKSCEQGIPYLKAAGGNFDEVYRFLTTDKDPLRIKLLDVLSAKDLLDLKAEVLEEHVREAKQYEDRYEDEIFIKYVLSPRISYEPLTKYRNFINHYFTNEQKKAFASSPDLVWEYVNSIKDPELLDYDLLIASPAGSLTLQAVNAVSKKVLFAAILRTLGVPARLNETDASPEYYNGSHFVKVTKESNRKAALKLIAEEGSKWNYFQSFSIGIFNGGRYETLDLSSMEFIDHAMNLSVNAGDYRIITSNRLPNGDILAGEYYFTLVPGHDTIVKCINLHQNKEQKEQAELNIALPEVAVRKKNGKEVFLNRIYKEKSKVFIWIEEGKEPTEHIFNELMEQKDQLNQQKVPVSFIVKSEEALNNPSFKKALECLPFADLYYDKTRTNVETLSAILNIPATKLPFVIVSNKENKAIYASSGYNVGSVDQILKFTAGR